jgi:3-oxoacyl-[acyl-carrier protein] reductase
VTRPENSCALVTGGSRGIGAAVCERLAADGWRVAVNFRSGAEDAERVARAIVDCGGHAEPIGADICDPAAAGELIERAGRLGPVTCLVNNAGIRADDLALSLSEEDWSAVLETNLSAAFRLTRLALRGMLRARFGRVVNIGSVIGPRANAGQANYAAAKAGLIAMGKTVAVEVARRGVTVNTVAPGLIETDMTRGLDGTLLGAIPARRAGTPHDVAACVAFLASEAAGYVNASTLFVDGGLSA